MNNKENIASDLSNIGLLYEEMENNNEAYQYYESAYNINKKLNLKEKMKIDLENLKRITKKIGDLKLFSKYEVELNLLK